LCSTNHNLVQWPREGCLGASRAPEARGRATYHRRRHRTPARS